MSTVTFECLTVESGLPDSRFDVRFKESDGGLNESISTPDSLFEDRSTVLKLEKVCRHSGISPIDFFIKVIDCYSSEYFCYLHIPESWFLAKLILDMLLLDGMLGIVPTSLLPTKYRD